MKAVHDPDVRTELRDRLERLAPGRAARWGSMTPAAALYHLNAAMRLALGELEARPVGNPAFWHTTGKAIALGDQPWPERAPTSPEALATGPVDFDQEREQFATLLERIAATAEDAAWPAHPRLGPLTGREWSRFTYNHTDHHFRQFGV